MSVHGLVPEWDNTVFVRVALVFLVLALLVLLVRLFIGARRRPTPDQYGANPNPTNITDEMWWLWQQLLALEPGSQLGGIYANKPGYHNARKNLPHYDYSVCDNPPDQGGPSSAAAAIDWTFPEAHGGDYRRIARYTKRLIDSGKDPDDPRMDGWREVYGNADDDTYVEGWDFRYGHSVTSDSSHLWHIHISENRDQTTSQTNKEALLSVLRGETVQQWLGAGAGGDGAVLLNCPYDADRLDLLYVGSTGEVNHRWYTSGGMTALWNGTGGKENLGGVIIAGTLTAAWLPDGSAINIAGLGAPDEPGCPLGSGQYWGFMLGRDGKRSGWGSLAGVYGILPWVQAAEAP